MDKKLSLVSTEYSLHINHISKARDMFERECCGFLDQVTNFLCGYFEEINEKDLKVEFRPKNINKSSSSGNPKNFKVGSMFGIYVKMGKDTKSKKEVIGFLKTGIHFDTNDQIFNWYFKFENKNKLDSQIDERVLAQIKKQSEEVKADIFTSFETLKYDDLFFFKKPLDNNFVKDFEGPVMASFNILLDELSNSAKFLELHGKRTVNRVKRLREKNEAA